MTAASLADEDAESLEVNYAYRYIWRILSGEFEHLVGHTGRDSGRRNDGKGKCVLSGRPQ